MTPCSFPGCFRSQRMTLSLHATSLAGQLFFVVLLLHVFVSSTVVAERNDILGPPSGGTCECCFAGLASQCCLDCGAKLLPEGSSQLAPFGFRLPREEVARYLRAMEAAAVAARGWAESHGPSSETSLPGCHCCVRELFQSRRPGLMFLACCSVCEESMRIAEVSRNALAPALRILPLDLPALSGSSGDVSGGAAEKEERSARRTQKRMTSMDCMCCMNSGISDCCSRCRIF